VKYLEGGLDAKIVVLDYADLVDPHVDLSASIEEAFGFNGLGLLTVRGVPDLTALRSVILPLTQKFATLPDEIKDKTAHKDSMYSFGWSHGREFLEGKPDFSKGSYYNNPVYNRPFEDEELIKKYPSFCHPNIWPEEMPELEPAFLNMGRLVVEVGTLLARHVDRYVSSQLSTYEPGKLENIIKTSKTAKGRLLHYFPLKDSDSADEGNLDFSSWCGWHNDHGSLTGLVPPMHFDEEGKEVPNPDPTSGLYIKSRSGAVVKAPIPSDYLGFQIGETACIHSGGHLQATPHAVRGAVGPKSRGVSRETMAVFMEPMWDYPMSIPQGATEETVTRGSVHLPRGVPALATRWKPSQNFGEFTTQTLSSYY